MLAKACLADSSFSVARPDASKPWDEANESFCTMATLAPSVWALRAAARPEVPQPTTTTS